VRKKNKGVGNQLAVTISQRPLSERQIVEVNGWVCVEVCVGVRAVCVRGVGGVGGC
jgi:hypothetical protein